MVLTTCSTCGTAYSRDSSNSAECQTCRPDPERAGTRRAERQADYDWTWRKLSERARRIQPFCSDCNTTDDLTTDHTPEAWRRYEQGRAIRLQDVEVVCRRCNAARGAARTDAMGSTWTRPRPPLPDLETHGE